MNSRVKVFWEKHEAWVAPIAMVLFLWSGVQLGIPIGESRGQAASVQQIADLNASITLKDERLREMQNLQLKDKDALVDAVKQSVSAASDSAAAAKDSAAAAKDSARKSDATDATAPFK